jgi:hypothetical protein
MPQDGTPLIRPTSRPQGTTMKAAPRLLPAVDLFSAIDLLGTRKFTAASIAKADRRHPGVPIQAMVGDAKMFAIELKETIGEMAKTIDGEDPQMKVIQQILALLGGTPSGE